MKQFLKKLTFGQTIENIDPFIISSIIPLQFSLKTMKQFLKKLTFH